MNFKPFIYPVDELYSSNKILKITDFVKLVNCIFVKEFLNKTTLEPFHHYFHKQTDNRSHRTRRALRMPTHPNMVSFQLNTRQPQTRMRTCNSIPQTYLRNLKLKSQLHSNFVLSRAMQVKTTTQKSIHYRFYTINVLIYKLIKFMNSLVLYVILSRALAQWLATCARNPKVPGSSSAATYVQR